MQKFCLFYIYLFLSTTKNKINRSNEVTPSYLQNHLILSREDIRRTKFQKKKDKNTQSTLAATKHTKITHPKTTTSADQRSVVTLGTGKQLLGENSNYAAYKISSVNICLHV